MGQLTHVGDNRLVHRCTIAMEALGERRIHSSKLLYWAGDNLIGAYSYRWQDFNMKAAEWWFENIEDYALFRLRWSKKLHSD